MEYIIILAVILIAACIIAAAVLTVGIMGIIFTWLTAIVCWYFIVFLFRFLSQVI